MYRAKFVFQFEFTSDVNTDSIDEAVKSISKFNLDGALHMITCDVCRDNANIIYRENYRELLELSEINK